MGYSLNRRCLRTLQFATAVAFMLGAALSAGQSTYPSRPIRLIVPYPPGALTDLLARAIGQRLAVALDQPIIIDNKAGAGTLVGAEIVAKAAPDGYTLLMATSTTLGISPLLYPQAAVDPQRDFAPVSQVGSVNFFLICNPAFPARNVQQMLEAIRAAPGRYNYASVGSGSPHHLFMEILKADYGLDLQHVPYKGTAAAVSDLIAGRIDVMFADATIAVPNIHAGKVVALGTSAAKPTTLIPSVAPIASAVPGFDWQAWQGIVAPAGTPKEIVERLWTELQKIQAMPQFNDDLLKFGMEPLAGKTPAEFAATISQERPRWAAAIRTSGAKVE
jgi:tripartite-type tricarboxylate transporter receptor subunit TctC